MLSVVKAKGVDVAVGLWLWSLVLAGAWMTCDRGEEVDGCK